MRNFVLAGVMLALLTTQIGTPAMAVSDPAGGAPRKPLYWRVIRGTTVCLLATAMAGGLMWTGAQIDRATKEELPPMARFGNLWVRYRIEPFAHGQPQSREILASVKKFDAELAHAMDRGSSEDLRFLVVRAEYNVVAIAAYRRRDTDHEGRKTAVYQLESFTPAPESRDRAVFFAVLEKLKELRHPGATRHVVLVSTYGDQPELLSGLELLGFLEDGRREEGAPARRSTDVRDFIFVHDTRVYGAYTSIVRLESGKHHFKPEKPFPIDFEPVTEEKRK